MSAALTFTVDESLAQYLALPKQVRGATVRSLNRAIVSGQAVMARFIASDTGLKSGDIKKAFRLTKATDGNPTASLSAGLKRIPLIQFTARGPEPSRGRGRGVSYKLQGGREALPSAFIATMTSGHRGVFMRAPSAKRRGPAPNRSQLPIRELFGPSLGHVFQKYQPQGQARATDAFIGNLEHELGRVGLSMDEAIAAAASSDTDDGTD